MIIEINSLPTQSGIIYFDKKKNECFIVPFEEFSHELNKEVSSLKEQVEKNSTQLTTFIENDPIKVVDELKKEIQGDKSKERLIFFTAYAMLNDSIKNDDTKDYPENFEDIRNWVYNPKGEMPKELKHYVDILKGIEKEGE